MTRAESTPLSSNEEITLRRVAHGQSDVAHLRAEDLARLRALKLIDNGGPQPSLTAAGKRQYDLLPRAHSAMVAGAQDDLMAMLGQLMAKKPVSR